jgi:hypothetical protein
MGLNQRQRGISRKIQEKDTITLAILLMDYSKEIQGVL